MQLRHTYFLRVTSSWQFRGPFRYTACIIALTLLSTLPHVFEEFFPLLLAST